MGNEKRKPHIPQEWKPTSLSLREIAAGDMDCITAAS